MSKWYLLLIGNAISIAYLLFASVFNKYRLKSIESEFSVRVSTFPFSQNDNFAMKALLISDDGDSEPPLFFYISLKQSTRRVNKQSRSQWVCRLPQFYFYPRTTNIYLYVYDWKFVFFSALTSNSSRSIYIIIIREINVLCT